MNELDTMRHSCAHVMAAAVQEMFPDAQFGFGPPIEDGFYYDFELPRQLSPDDFKEIEQRMRRLAKSADHFEYKEIDGKSAIELFTGMNQTYKVEAINNLVSSGEPISLYKSGPFLDLCRGPHVGTTKQIGHFKILSVAGAYWLGDENNPQLQRLYATSFPTKDELTTHLARLEEARRRDHRILAKQLDLFSTNTDVGAGLILWHPKGGVLREIIENYWREEHRKHNYDIVFTPHIGRKKLWDISGHTQWYQDGLFPEMELENQSFINKPMNCPFHVQIFDSQTRSYRDLPLRYGELGTVYRFERSGVLHGALRVRGFTQDDAHIFCRHDQFAKEVGGALDIAYKMLGTFGFTDLKLIVSVRDENRDKKYVGSDEMWTLAEQGLIDALTEKNIEYQRVEGEAAFYGPKIDVMVEDAIGRQWQLSTIQVDFNLPERFDIDYEDSDGSRRRPVMVHRALLGSIERFTAILIEHFAGAFPVWLAPVQAVLIPIADRHIEYCNEVALKLASHGIRIHVDDRGERMNRKIRDAQKQKVPYMLIAGDRDVESNNVSVRLRNGEDIGAITPSVFAQTVQQVSIDRSESYGFGH